MTSLALNNRAPVFYISSTLFKSHQDDEGTVMKGLVHWSTKSWAKFHIQWDSNLELCDPKSGALTIQPSGPSCSKHH